MPRGNPNWKRFRDYHAEIDRLDVLSRTRALTLPESVLLERLLSRVEHKGTRRASYGTNKELARLGIGRHSSLIIGGNR